MADAADGCCLDSLSSQQTAVQVAASAGSQFGEPLFTFGGQKSWMAVTFQSRKHNFSAFHSLFLQGNLNLRIFYYKVNTQLFSKLEKTKVGGKK